VRRFLLIANPVALVLILVWASPAAANSPVTRRTYDSSNYCTDVTSQVDRGSGGGYSWNGDQSLTNYFFWHCQTGHKPGAGNIEGYYEWYRWDGVSQWLLCAATSGYFNQSNDDTSLIASYNYGTQPWCSPGDYGTLAGGWVRSVPGGNYNGGFTWSGYMYLGP